MQSRKILLILFVCHAALLAQDSLVLYEKHVGSFSNAIKFSLDNEAESEADITSEIERYMAIPGQALAYKIGQLKIIEIRKRAEETLGGKFSIKKFHDEVLISGCLPIEVFENKMNAWINSQK